MWSQAADCSRGGYQPLETHDCRQWKVVYVRSLAARMTIGDSNDWNRREADLLTVKCQLEQMCLQIVKCLRNFVREYTNHSDDERRILVTSEKARYTSLVRVWTMVTALVADRKRFSLESVLKCIRITVLGWTRVVLLVRKYPQHFLRHVSWKWLRFTGPFCLHGHPQDFFQGWAN